MTVWRLLFNSPGYEREIEQYILGREIKQDDLLGISSKYQNDVSFFTARYLEEHWLLRFLRPLLAQRVTKVFAEQLQKIQGSLSQTQLTSIGQAPKRTFVCRSTPSPAPEGELPEDELFVQAKDVQEDVATPAPQMVVSAATIVSFLLSVRTGLSTLVQANIDKCFGGEVQEPLKEELLKAIAEATLNDIATIHAYGNLEELLNQNVFLNLAQDATKQLFKQAFAQAILNFLRSHNKDQLKQEVCGLQKALFVCKKNCEKITTSRDIPDKLKSNKQQTFVYSNVKQFLKDYLGGLTRDQKLNLELVAEGMNMSIGRAIDDGIQGNSGDRPQRPDLFESGEG